MLFRMTSATCSTSQEAMMQAIATLNTLRRLSSLNKDKAWLIVGRRFQEE
jgi:hypothetical protein